jgi:sulfur-oxidizing protein SoxZ
MESGQRKDKKTGELIPRQIINKFTATFNGQEIITIDMEPALSANPYFEFDVKLPESGEFVFTWVDDDGSTYESKNKVTVS